MAVAIFPDGFCSRVIRLACGAALASCAALGHATSDHQTGGPYVPTPPTVVNAMLELAKVGPRDFVVDLGSGDGRIVLTAAARFQARGMGVDIDAELVDKSNAAAQRLGLAGRVQFRRQDVLAADLRRATVLTLYLMPEMMISLQPKLLKELRPGTRIVSHDFDLGAWRPDRSIEVETAEKYDLTGNTWTSTVHLWIVPAAVQGSWQGTWPDSPGSGFRLEISQQFQQFGGTLSLGDRKARLEAGGVEGARVRFNVVDGEGRRVRYSGKVAGDRMEGEMRGAGATKARWSAVRVP